MSAKTPVWLDCDPGHDDAFAIILAAEHPSLDLLGISTVHGNASMANVTANALSLLTAIGRTDIPVYAGCRKPYMRPAVHAPDIHGESGIDGTELLPESATALQSGNAILAMYNAIMKTPFQSTMVVATGTLTNVALLFAAFPEVVDHIKGVSIMGGAFGDRDDSHGNITKWAEFNIYCDPESAESIMSNPALSGRITLIPLDLTHTVLATEPVLTKLLNCAPANGEDLPPSPSNLRKMLHDLLTYFANTYADVFGITAGPPLHDPLALAAIIPTDEIAWEIEEARVAVTCNGQEIGQTVKIKNEEKSERGAELGKAGVEEICLVKIPRSVDVDAFWGVIMGVLEKCDGRFVWPEKKKLEL